MISIIDDLAYEHPEVVSAGTFGVCFLTGLQLGAPIAGVAVGVVVSVVTFYSWTRGSAHLRYLRRHPPGSIPA